MILIRSGEKKVAHKGYSILSREELEKLNTKRLLALKKRLYPLSAKRTQDKYMGRKMMHPEVIDQIDLIKKICNIREHILRGVK